MMSKHWLRTVTLTGVLAMGGMTMASAHHSVSAYDKSKQVILNGTVKEFKWANPHTWLYVMVPDDKGGETEWALEGGSISVLARNGWRAKTLQPGQKVRVFVNPNRDGSPGGGFLTVTLDDGTTYSIGVL